MMQPVVLETARLRLDQPVAGDCDRVVEYCRDPLFEAFMTLPWPYETRHADYFLGELVPRGWADASELTWAIRSAPGRELMGVIGWHPLAWHGELAAADDRRPRDGWPL
jgi:RimJ/RimL family protein N-acetyltransferase